QVAQDRFHIGTPSLTVAGPARCGTAGGGAHGRPASALTSYEPSRISHKNEPTTPARAPREGARALRSHKATRLSHKKAPRGALPSRSGPLPDRSGKLSKRFFVRKIRRFAQKTTANVLSRVSKTLPE